jgi:hypothetical protein
MMTEWVSFSFTEPGLMYSIFMHACGSLKKQSKNSKFDYMRLIYKAKCIESVKQALDSYQRGVSDVTIMKVLSLASEEVSH